MSLSIHIAPPVHGTLRITVGGRLDTHSYEEFDRKLAPLLDSALKSVVLDLAGLDYISSAGVRSIFKVRKVMAARDGKVLVANLQPQIQKVFDVVKAVPLGDIFPTMAEVDAYLDAMQRKVLQGDDDE